MKRQYDVDPLEDHNYNLGYFSGVCTFCKYLISGIEHTCSAFPEGIPDEIWTGKNRHLEPVEGDRGIRFELRPDAKVKPW